MKEEQRPDVLLGTTLEHRYEVRALQARGGMATVYRAWDARLERDVALKVMHPHLAGDANFRNRFSREARSAARLSHPNVVPVYDQGEDSGYVFLTMEFLDGMTLREHLHEVGPLTIDETLTITESVLQALDCAHQAGIVHRDVKPENVIITDASRIVVTDFGLARAAGAATSSTSTALLGTVAYIAPEVVTLGNASTRSDLYSLGIMIYEMLTGVQPHRGELPVHIAFKHVHEDVPNPSARVATVPPELDALVAWCCERDPQHRPESARAVLENVRELRKHLEPNLLNAIPVPVTELSTAQIQKLQQDTNPALDCAVDNAESTPATDLVTLDTPTSAVTESDSEDDKPNPGSSEFNEDLPEFLEEIDSDVADFNSRSAHPHLFPVQVFEADAVPSVDDSAGLPRTEAGGRRIKPDQKKTRRPRRWLVTLCLLLLFALSTAGFAWFYVGPGAEREVPATVGMTLAEAENTLQNNDFKLKTLEEYSDSVPKGEVISTSPKAGEKLHRNSEVTVTISKGPELFTVPKITGQTKDAALQAITAANLKAIEDPAEYSETVPEGVVISQKAANDSLPRGSEVHYVLSKGKEPIDVPKVTGLTEAAAKQLLGEKGLGIKVTKAFHGSVPAGSIISQSPAEGTLTRGETVSVVVSNGPEMVAVPSVVGKPVNEAKAELEKAGLKADVKPFGSLPPVLGLVREQSVAPAQKTPKGSTIVITIV